MNCARGSALATTLILLLILALVCATLTRLLLSRHTLESKVESEIPQRISSTQGAQGWVSYCLQNQNPPYPNGTCDVGAYQTCIGQFQTAGGGGIQVAGSGAPPNCTLNIQVPP